MQAKPINLQKTKVPMSIYAEDHMILQQMSQATGYPMVQLLHDAVMMLFGASVAVRAQQAGK
jgi:hypothetical protein